MRLLILVAVSLFALSGCAGKSDPPDEAPTGVTATAGDGLVLMSWDPLPDRIYWIFYKLGATSVAPGDIGSIAIKNAVSPRVVTGLQNDSQYAFIMNATEKTSAAGPNSQVVTSQPRLAGDTWIQGAVQGAQNLNALAFNGFGRYVAVGDGTTIFAGDFNYAHTDPVGVSDWLIPTTPPTNGLGQPPFVTDFKAVTYNGMFTALGSNGSVATSSDGLNWTAQSPVQTVPVTGLSGIAFGFVNGAGTFFAVGSGGQMYTSTDLTKPWTLSTALNTASDLTGIAVLNGFFVVTGADGALLFSPDGKTWFPQTISGLPSGTTLRSAAFMPNATLVPGSVAYVVVGDGGVIVTATQSSIDANNIPTDWRAIVLTGAQNLRSVTVGGSTGLRFLAVGQGGAVVRGDSVVNGAPVNPIQWSVPLPPQAPTGDFSSVHFFTGQYLTVGAAGANAVSH